MAANPIDIYCRQIERELHAGNATEPTYSTAMKPLIEPLVSAGMATNENVSFDKYKRGKPFRPNLNGHHRAHN
jgi:hypothetical protein